MKNQVFTTILFLLLFNFSLKGQNAAIEEPEQLWWINLGMGILYPPNYGSDNSPYIPLMASFTKPLSSNFLLTGRITYAEDVTFFLPPIKSEIYRDYSFLAGFYSKGRVGYASLGAGLGMDSGRFEKDGKLEDFSTIGLPLESQVFLTLPFVGLGLVGMANINSERSTWGFTISLQFGNLR